MRVGDTLAYPPKPNATQSGKNSCQQLGPSVAFRHRAHDHNTKAPRKRTATATTARRLIVHIVAPKNRQVGTPPPPFPVASYLGMNCGTPRAIVHVERVSVLSFLPRASKQEHHKSNTRIPRVNKDYSSCCATGWIMSSLGARLRAFCRFFELLEANVFLLVSRTWTYFFGWFKLVRTIEERGTHPRVPQHGAKKMVHDWTITRHYGRGFCATRLLKDRATTYSLVSTTYMSQRVPRNLLELDNGYSTARKCCHSHVPARALRAS